MWQCWLDAKWSEFRTGEEGQDLVEYSLLMAFIAVMSIAIIQSFGTTTSGVWSKVNSGLSSAVNKGGS